MNGCDIFAPNGADIDIGWRGAINISLLTERKTVARFHEILTQPATSLYHSIGTGGLSNIFPCTNF